MKTFKEVCGVLIAITLVVLLGWAVYKLNAVGSPTPAERARLEELKREQMKARVEVENLERRAETVSQRAKVLLDETKVAEHAIIREKRVGVPKPGLAKEVNKK
jgi:cell division protein FtsB